MNVLVDTCTLIWALQSPDKLSAQGQSILEDGNHQVTVSVVSFWEISLKHAIGKLTFGKASPEMIPGFISEMGWSTLPLNATTAASFHRLPLQTNHRDPFDRMLVWQAITEKIPLVSADSSMPAYIAHGLKLIQ